MAAKAAFQFAEYQPLDQKGSYLPPPGAIPKEAAYLFAPVVLPKETRTQLDTLNAIDNFNRDRVPSTRFSKQLVPVVAYSSNPRESRLKDTSYETPKEFLSADQIAWKKRAVLAMSRLPVNERLVVDE